VLDPNEVGGFISHCTNLDYLLDLRAHLEQRIVALGGARKQPREVQMMPGVQDGKSTSPPARAVAPPPPPQPQPEPECPTGPAGPAEVSKKPPTVELFPKGEPRKLVAAGTLYSVTEMIDHDGHRIAFEVHGLTGGGHYMVDVGEDRLTCDCPDFFHRHAKAGPSDPGCKHIQACRHAFKLEAPPVAPAGQESQPDSEAQDVPEPETEPEV
jgi:hypothetical protein